MFLFVRSLCPKCGSAQITRGRSRLRGMYRWLVGREKYYCTACRCSFLGTLTPQPLLVAMRIAGIGVGGGVLLLSALLLQTL